ncbi:MAG: cytochrome c3 family protein [Actinomycetota bacterium]|nr:cytochrome c3 family protein [Actinomycetota bacterium]
MRKRLIALAVVTAAVIIALTPGVARANFSIHGGYTMDTDACAGCHRAHTAASSITWTKTDNTQGSALLLGTSTEIYQFCYTCHDSVSLGAETNVETGIYEGTTNGTQNDPLNGGGFEATLFPTQHMYTGASWMVYGGSTEPDILGNLKDGPQVEMSCSTCHDVHGSSNYRLLKDVLPALERPSAAVVGGYDGTALGYTEEDPKPTPWVVSAEPGYPTTGWLLHAPGALQVAGYTPNYTQPMYAKAPDADLTPGPDPEKGMSGWCSGCHIQYINPTGAENSAGVVNVALGYDSNDGFGAVVRHRHPVNVPLSNYLGARSLIITTQPLPLAHGSSADVATNSSTDWIDCLTCHVAHGSSAVMTGYANVADSTDPQPDSGTGGVPPTDGNALLRMNSRGVCESCHNK